MRTFRGIVGIFAFAAVGVAQQAASPGGTGTVSGHVTFGDTQRPARFASVTLFGVPEEISQSLDPNTKPDMPAMQAQMKAALSANMVQAQTGLDGSYSLTNVAPGDYYVFASVAGYVSPLNAVMAAKVAGADMNHLPFVPVVHVAADRAVTQDVTAVRGAAVQGRVLWEDGAPVAGVSVVVQSTKDEASQPPPQFAMLAAAGGLSGLLAQTDDKGNFRIAGLAGGDYRVQAALQTSGAINMQKGAISTRGLAAARPLVVYAPSALHKSDARTVTLKAGDEATDVLVTINLGALHSVSGRVTSLEDGHGINSGTVMLRDVNDKAFTRAGTLDAQGNYKVTLVPAGTYDLTVDGAADTEAKKAADKGILKIAGEKTLKSYSAGGTLKQQVIVKDVDAVGQNVSLAPDKTVQEGVDLDKLLNGK